MLLNLGLLKTKSGNATLPLPSACRIALLSSFHFPPCATPCLTDEKVYVLPVDPPDQALPPSATRSAAPRLNVRRRLGLDNPALIASDSISLTDGSKAERVRGGRVQRPLRRRGRGAPARPAHRPTRPARLSGRFATSPR